MSDYCLKSYVGTNSPDVAVRGTVGMPRMADAREQPRTYTRIVAVYNKLHMKYTN